MKQSIASAPPATWNLKNQPSNVEEVEESPGHTEELMSQLPAAALGIVRRQRGILILSVAFLGALVAWYFVRSTRDA